MNMGNTIDMFRRLQQGDVILTKTDGDNISNIAIVIKVSSEYHSLEQVGIDLVHTSSVLSSSHRNIVRFTKQGVTETEIYSSIRSCMENQDFGRIVEFGVSKINHLVECFCYQRDQPCKSQIFHQET